MQSSNELILPDCGEDSLVGIVEDDKIRVTLLLNPFSVADRKEYYIQRKNIGQLLADHGLVYSKDIIVIDGDQVIYGNSSVPHNNHLIIRVFPTGTGNVGQDVATGEKVAGGVLALAGVIIAIAGSAIGLAPLGIAIAGVGVSLLIGGIIAYNTNINIPEYEDTKQLPSIRGSKNQTRVNGKIPVLLGRHRIYPDNAGLPYINTNTSTSIQTLNQLFCAGYSNMEIDMDTVKIGETFFKPNSTGNSTVFTNAAIKANYGGSYVYSYYEGRRVDINYGEKLVFTDSSGQIPIIKTTSTNTKKIDIRLLFPNGLTRYDNNGDKNSLSVDVRIEYKKTGTADSEYQNISPSSAQPSPSASYRGTVNTGENKIVFNLSTYSSPPSYFVEGNSISSFYFSAGTYIESVVRTLSDPFTYEYILTTNNPAIGSATDALFTVSPPTAYIDSYTRITNNTNIAFRKVYSIDLDNLTPAGDDYNTPRQYDIRLTRISKQETNSKYIDDLVLEGIKTENGVFNNAGGFDDTPIIESAKENLTLVELNIQATDQLKDVIEQVNFEGTVKTREYSGSGSGTGAWTADTLTRNPASMFLYVLTNNLINQHPIDDSKIDFPALEEWHTFCTSKGFTCDAYVNYDITTNDLLSNICTCGRASWNIIDGKYTVIIDNTKTDIVQMFTPRNSSNYSATKTFPDRPTVLKSEFVNADSGYVQETISIYNKRITGTVTVNAGYNTVVGTDTLFTTELSIGENLQIGTESHTVQSITNDTTLLLVNNHLVGATDVNVYVEDETVISNSQLFGVTSSDHAWKLGKYQLAVAEYRPTVHTFNADIENMICTRGDRIKLRHDVPLYGLFDGRVKTVIDDGSNITGFISDEIISMIGGTSYTVRFRQQDGGFVDSPVTNPGTGDYTTLTLSTPIAGLTAINIYDLFTFGETGYEDIDLIISEISYSRDFEGTLTCVDYSPEIFNADTGTIPAYDPKISKQGDGAGSINPNNIQDVEGTLEATIEIVNASTESLTARFPDSFQSNYDASYYFTNDNEYIYYVNYDNGNKIYKKNLDKVNNGNAITTDASGCIAYFAENLIYVNITNGGVLYKKSVDDLTNGEAVTTNQAWCPTVDDAGNCYYINYSDNNKIYVCDVNGVGNDGIEFLDVGAIWISYGNGYLFYMESDGIVHSYELFTTTDTAITTDQINKFSVLDEDELIVSKMDDFIAYSIDYDGTNETPEFEYADYVNCNFGNLVYSSGTLSNNIFPALQNKVVGISVLESSPSYANITGDITTGINTISNISNVDLDKLAKGDFIIGTGIPDGTIINLIGAGYIYISNPATATTTDVVFEVSGSRIFLNANKVIVPGTIEAELLKASAINSKARASDGNLISEVDLDAGTQIYRKADGTIMFDFDPNRTGEELKLAGTLSGASTSVEENAGYTLDAETGDAVFNNITLKGSGNFGGLSVNQLFNGEKIFNIGDSVTDITTWLSSISLGIDITVAVIGTIGTDTLQYIYWLDSTTVFYRIDTGATDAQVPGTLSQQITLKTVYDAFNISSDIIPINTNTLVSIGNSANRPGRIYGGFGAFNKGFMLENFMGSSGTLTQDHFYNTIIDAIYPIYDIQNVKYACSGFITLGSSYYMLLQNFSFDSAKIRFRGYDFVSGIYNIIDAYDGNTSIFADDVEIFF